jgi:putative FmdB family regulatory protein
MPTFEYRCLNCKVGFEELLISPDDVKQYKDSHPCPKCAELALRTASITNFAFKAPAGQTQGSGVHGQSGVHDLDYPALDKAVGRSSEHKWDVYNKRKAKRDQARKEAGTNFVATTADGKTVPVDPKKLEIREKALTTFRQVKEASKK